MKRFISLIICALAIVGCGDTYIGDGIIIRQGAQSFPLTDEGTAYFKFIRLADVRDVNQPWVRLPHEALNGFVSYSPGDTVAVFKIGSMRFGDWLHYDYDLRPRHHSRHSLDYMP